MLYSSMFFMREVWETDRPVWLAHYTDQAVRTDYSGNYSIWQMCSDGRIAGIDGDVDVDIVVDGELFSENVSEE